MKQFYVITLFIFSTYSEWFDEVKNFNLTNERIDVLIACHEKDSDVLQICVKNVKRYVHNVGRIIVASEKRLTNDAEWFDDSKFPFSKQTIANEFAAIDPSFNKSIAKKKRVGWYFKQILNFYAAFVIPGISSNILILDGDVVFLKTVRFTDENGNMLHVPGTENHRPYFEHMKRFLPGLKRVINKYSGISHHMLFQKPILEDLFNLVETHHKMDFWKAYCRCVDPNHIQFSGAADYEIYFNFVLMRTKQFKIRTLEWENIGRLSLINNFQKEGYDFVACHHHSRLDLPPQKN